jgi:hypothetical protein
VANSRAFATTVVRSRHLPSPLLPLSFWMVLLFVPSAVFAQISPGPLSKAHQSLSGTSQCASCHQFGASTPTFKCLDCHREVAQRLASHHGYHALLEMRNPNGKDCVRCHLEHNGADFPLVHWEPALKQFDHGKTGYPLEGKHAGVACERCHTTSNIAVAERPLIRYKDLTKSYFGLTPDCLTCHTDPHKGQLGNNCAQCHNVSDWKAAKQFDHSKTRYPLTGAHIQVACEKCHKPDQPGGAARYRDMQFERCTACHLDPHRGSFKQRCEECHATVSWKKISAGFEFDHSKTKYPLLGMHAKLSCVACHVNGEFQRPVAFANCVDCHRTDPHSGQFVSRPKKGECAECHTVDGWKPSLFGVREHTSSAYPLQGKHAKVECDKCHIPAGKDTMYKVKFAACTDCHKDAHDGQFSAARYRDKCESCHTVQDFHRTTFTIVMHRKTSFALAGAHVAVACAECHKVGLGGRVDKVLPFHFQDQTCTACHQDPHKGEFRERMAQKRADGTVLGCQACHNDKSWIDVDGFDHSKTKFPLLGAHRSVSCGECHKVQTATRKVQFQGTPQNCEACHVDPHAGQFAAKERKTACADCHNVQRWAPSTFDHNTRTHFPLEGGHANVKCDECHNLFRTVAGKEILFYKPTPEKCADCHGTTAKPLPPG